MKENNKNIIDNQTKEDAKTIELFKSKVSDIINRIMEEKLNVSINNTLEIENKYEGIDCEKKIHTENYACLMNSLGGLIIFASKRDSLSFAGQILISTFLLGLQKVVVTELLTNGVVDEYELPDTLHKINKVADESLDYKRIGKIIDEMYAMPKKVN